MVHIPELEIGDVVQVSIDNVICTAQVLRPTNAEAQYAILVLKNPHTWYGTPQLFRRVPINEIQPLYRTVNGIRRTYRHYYNPYSLSLYETHLKHVDEALERLFEYAHSSADDFAKSLVAAEQQYPDCIRLARLSGALRDMPAGRHDAFLDYLETTVASLSRRDMVPVSITPARREALLTGSREEGKRPTVTWTCDPAAAAKRLSEFPHLSATFPESWIGANAGNYDLFWWHPVFAPDSQVVLDYLRRLELALDYLFDPDESEVPVEGLAHVVSQLREARNLGDFTSHRDEILLGAALPRQHQDCVFGGKGRGADLRIRLQDGSSLEVELTTTEKMRDFERLLVAVSLARLEADTESRFTCFVQYADETAPLGSDAITELAAQVFVEIGDEYNRGEVAPATLSAEIEGVTFRVEMHCGSEGSGMVVPVRIFEDDASAGFLALEDFFKTGPDAVWSKIEDEMGQLAGDHHRHQL
jgi:hypothetical protein